jgi:hypothetical protein
LFYYQSVTLLFTVGSIDALPVTRWKAGIKAKGDRIMSHDKDQHKPKAPVKGADKDKAPCTGKDKAPCSEKPKVHASGADQRK